MTIWAAGKRVGPIAPEGTIGALRWLLVGSSVSMLGSRVTAIAYPLLILYLTGSPVDAGWAACAATAPTILVYLPAGALIDRADPRRVMLCSEVGRGIAIAGVMVMVTWWQSIPLLIAAAMIEESLGVFTTLAERRYLGSAVEREMASSALVRIEGRTHMVIMAGRPLGGLLFEVGPTVPFLADVLTFIFSICILIGTRGGPPRGEAPIAELAGEIEWGRLRRALRRPPRPAGQPIRRDIREGLTWLMQHRFARAAMVLSGSTTLICQALIMVFIAEAHARQMSSITIGIILAMSGVGGALGSAIASRLRIPAPHSLIKVQLLVWGMVFGILAVSGGRSAVWMAVVMGVLGFMGAMGNIEVHTYLVQNARETLARVTSIGRLTSFAACAVGPVIGGYLFQRCGIQGAVYWLLLIISLTAVYSALTPSMHASGRIGDRQEACPQTAQ